MALKKVNYVKNETVITAENLNNIQDNIITNASNITSANTSIAQVDSRLQKVETDNSTSKTNISNLQSSMSTAQSNISNLQTSIANKVRFVEVITLAASAWSSLKAVVKTTNTLLESDTPHIILNTVSTTTKEAYGKIDYAETFIDTDGVVKIRFVSLTEAPTVDLSLQIEVIR